MVKTTDKEAVARIEAALYSAGRPLKIEEIVRASGTESRIRATDLLSKIIKRTDATFVALEIAPLPDGSYVFQLKPEYNRHIRRYASKPILPKAVLKSLSCIAYKQPISSKDLVEIRGTGVYAHLKELKQKDFIKYESAGRLKIYSTTEKFQKYFGISGDTNTVKEMLFKKIKKPPVPNAGAISGGIRS